MIGITEEKALRQESVGLTKTKPLQTLLKLWLNDLLNTYMTNIPSVNVWKMFSIHDYVSSWFHDSSDDWKSTKMSTNKYMK